MTIPKNTVFFGIDSYDILNDFFKKYSNTKIFVLVDENTAKYCLPILQSYISIKFDVLKISAGEVYKNISTTTYLWQELTRLGADRTSILINLGGGVLTDMGGFAALTYKRGIKFINIPTTLLGMVDAAIGGKTGIDLDEIKNQVGLISLPEMVLIDDQYLKTLPQREYKSALAEILKYGLIADKDLWRELQIKSWNPIDLSVIKRSVEIKNEVVFRDLLEKGERKILNFGHTLGHALETHFLTKSVDEQLLHGEAIAVGMIMESYLSYKMKGFPEQKLSEVVSVINRIFPKLKLEKTDIEAVLKLVKHDKKNKNATLNFVLLEDIGKPVWDVEVTEDQVLEAIEYYNQL